MEKKIFEKGLVIYADDDPDDLYLVSEGFFAYAPKIDLIVVRDGVELLNCLETQNMEESICLIILDINMPRLDGKQTLRQLRNMEKYASIPVVLFSTSSSQRDFDFATKYNAGFVTKPRTMAAMSGIVDRFFDKCVEEVQRKTGTPV